MKKKGSILSEPFVWIFIVVVLGLVAIFGFTQIDRLMCFGSTTEGVTFVQDLDNNVKNVYSLSSGSSKKLTLNAPGSVDGVCFIDGAPQLTLIPYKELRDYIEVKATGNLDKNVFFVGDDCMPDHTLIDHLSVKGGTFCLNLAEGAVDVALENKGDTVEIRKI